MMPSVTSSSDGLKRKVPYECPAMKSSESVLAAGTEENPAKDRSEDLFEVRSEKHLKKDSQNDTNNTQKDGQSIEDKDSKDDSGLLPDRDGRILERLDEYIMDINTYQSASKATVAELELTDKDKDIKKDIKKDTKKDTNVSKNDTTAADTETQLIDSESKAGAKSSTDQIDENVKRFRVYEEACARVKDFYAEQHTKQTVEFNIQARVNFMTKKKVSMSVWAALEKLNALIDESDPDTELSQIEHALQTAEAIRKDGRPRWMQLVGLIHDLGKLLYFFESKGQWDVVGDTFPVGCAFDKRIIFYNEFRNNPDFEHPVYSTELGIYSEGCGLDSVMLSWGHDEYMYHIAKLQSKLPVEGLSMIRYHSFYAWHREGAYRNLMNAHDYDMLKCVQQFNPYDLYSKAEESVDVDKVRPYYQELIDEFFPKIVQF